MGWAWWMNEWLNEAVSHFVVHKLPQENRRASWGWSDELDGTAFQTMIRNFSLPCQAAALTTVPRPPPSHERKCEDCHRPRYICLSKSSWQSFYSRNHLSLVIALCGLAGAPGLFCSMPGLSRLGTSLQEASNIQNKPENKLYLAKVGLMLAQTFQVWNEHDPCRRPPALRAKSKGSNC